MSRPSTPTKSTTEDKNITGSNEVKTETVPVTVVQERLVVTEDDSDDIDDFNVGNDISLMNDHRNNDEIDRMMNHMKEMMNGMMSTFALGISQVMSNPRKGKMNNNNGANYSNGSTNRNSGIRNVNPDINYNTGHSNSNNTNVLDVNVPSNNGNNSDPLNTSNVSIHSNTSGNSKPTPHGDKPKMKIPTFNGSKIYLTIYKAYRIKIKQYVNYYNITDMHPVFCQSLTDQALIWYLAYVEAHPDIIKDDCDKIIEVLDKEYFNPLSKSKYRVDYDTMKAKEGETLTELVTRINNLASQAGLILRSNEDKKNKLYTLLPLHLRAAQCNTLIDPNVTYEEFVTYVVQSKEVHDQLIQQPRSRQIYSGNNINDGYNYNDYTLNNNLAANINNGNTNYNPRNNNYYHNNNYRSRNTKQRNNIICSYCQKVGHNTISCYHLLQEYQLKKPEAVQFWNSNNMNQKLLAYNNTTKNNNNNNNNTSTNHSNNTNPSNANSSTNNINNGKPNNNTNNNNTMSIPPINNTSSNINTDDSKSLIYINGSVNNLPISHMLLDEGSSFSLISRNTYTELLNHTGKSLRLTLSKNDLPVLKQADGLTSMKLIGSMKLDLRFDDINIGNFRFIIVDNLAHDVIIGRDIIAAANLSTINDNGTKIIQGLKLVESNVIIPNNVNIFSVRDTHILNANKIINHISAVINTAISEDNIETTPLEENTIATSKQLPNHLKGIVISNELSIEDRNKLITILIEYQDVFYKDGDPINPLNTTIKHTIRLVDNAEPIQAKLYSLPLTHRHAISEQVNKWLQLGILKPSYSPWSATCVVVDKKDQKLGRVCGNFQPLNKLTVNDAYPLKRIEDQKESFHGSIFYSSIDLKDAYIQVELDEKSKELTAIVTHDGLFQFERMIQGLKTAPATFHRIIDDAFKDVINICLAPYFDDLTVHSKSMNEHLNHLVQVFKIMRKFGFKAKASKVNLCVKELSWLGFILSDGTIKPDVKLVTAIENLAIPKNVNEVRMVTGLFNFYRSFIPRFAERCSPLDKLKRTDVNFSWGPEQQNAFNDLKSALMQYPVLRLPNMNKPYILDTDASTIGIGGILQQEDEVTKKNFVVSYYSRKLSDAEKKMGITDLEALALRDSIKKFNKYLIGQKFTVYVDHISLTYLKNLATLSGKLGRISIDLQQYNYEIKYKPGHEHLNVDCLSRLINDSQEPKKGEINNVSRIKQQADLSSFRQIQQADNFTVSVINYLNDNEIKIDEELEDKIKKYLQNNNNMKFEVHDGILNVTNTRKTKNISFQIVIPDENNFIKLQLAQSLHNPTHCGRSTLYKLMSSKFYWSGMSEYLNKFVDTCNVCQKVKRDFHNSIIEKQIILNQSKKSNEKPMFEPFSQITIDHLDLPTTESGFKCLLVIIDRATRLVKAIPCKSHESMESIEQIINQWIFNYGVPRVILSDNGKAFVNALMKELNKMLGIDHILSSPYNPQSHGLVERANQSIGKVLRALIEAHHDGTTNWDKYISHAVFAINTTINEATGFSPYELVYGRQVSYPIDRLLYDDEIFNSVGEYMQNLLNKQKINYAIVHENLLNVKSKNEIYNIDNNEKLRSFNVGDLVYKMKSKNQRKNKLDLLYEGPYTIQKKINNLCYQMKLTDSETAPLVLANVRQLKPYINADMVIHDASSATKAIDDIMKEFREIVKLRKPIDTSDYLTDAEIDLVYPSKPV